jgi:hypothetical protein
MSMLFGGFCAALAVFSYRTRNDSQRFFGDRVEIFRRGELLHTLRYSSVERVAYGFRGDNDQFLAFSGPQRQPLVSLSLVGDSSKAEPAELNNEKLMRLRDHLYDVVAHRMIRVASEAEGAAWFGQIRICRDGLMVGTSLSPWANVNVAANESNGQVSVRAHGQEVGRTSMIEDNVVAGLIAIEELRLR